MMILEILLSRLDFIREIKGTRSIAIITIWIRIMEELSRFIHYMFPNYLQIVSVILKLVPKEFLIESRVRRNIIKLSNHDGS